MRIADFTTFPDVGIPAPKAVSVPIAVIQDPELSNAAVRLYALLRHNADAHGNVRVNQAVLSLQLGASQATVSRCMAQLRRGKHIARVPIGRVSP